MSFIDAGNEAVRAAYKARAAAERNKPKYEQFGKQAIEDQTAQDLLSMEITGRAQRNAITAKANEKTREINKEAREYAKDKQRGAQMAGKLAGGAAMLGGAYFMSKQKDEPDEAIGMLQGYIDENNSADIEDQRDLQKKIDALSTGSSTKTVGELDAGGLVETNNTMDKPVSSYSAFPSSPALGGKTTATQAQMFKFAVQAGFSPENARTMAAIAMGESGGRLAIDTVQSGLDPSKSKEFSIGATQINVQAHGDKLKKLGYTADDLRDPVKNFQVAKMVHDEMGGFSPWSVYSSGKYKQYLN
jgi:hypothetical protein